MRISMSDWFLWQSLNSIMCIWQLRSIKLSSRLLRWWYNKNMPTKLFNETKSLRWSINKEMQINMLRSKLFERQFDDALRNKMSKLPKLFRWCWQENMYRLLSSLKMGWWTIKGLCQKLSGKYFRWEFYRKMS